MNNRLNTKTEVLTAKHLDKVIERQKRLGNSGHWSKFKLEVFLNRTRATINTWDQMLISLISDYARLWPGHRQPLTDYHRYCLELISKFQNRRLPYKPEPDLISFIKRNKEKFTLQTYINQYRSDTK